MMPKVSVGKFLKGISSQFFGKDIAIAEICRHSQVYLSATNEFSLLKNKNREFIFSFVPCFIQRVNKWCITKIWITQGASKVSWIRKKFAGSVWCVYAADLSLFLTHKIIVWRELRSLKLVLGSFRGNPFASFLSPAVFWERQRDFWDLSAFASLSQRHKWTLTKSQVWKIKKRKFHRKFAACFIQILLLHE